MTNLLGEPAYVGRFCGSNTYEVTPEVVAFYSDALGDDHANYAKWAPPLLHHSECYEFVGEWYLKNIFGNLHAQQDWELFSPIRVGSRIRSVSTITERYEKRGRLYIVNETDLFDADDSRLLVRGRTHQSFLPEKKEGEDDGNFVVDKNTSNQKQKKERPPFPVAQGPDLPSFEKVIDERRCWMFSGPEPNYHTSREHALKLGFPNIVVQGMMSTCFVSQVMHESFAEGWLAGGKMALKLTNVLWVDEEIVARGKIRDEVSEGSATRVHCDVWVDKKDGTRIALGTASALRT
ncbi:MAG: MaoC/PaaZ C-terminal domain-containing protein [Myxococcota bacterium]|nr:MaoC/PaaZ C-terminal domain-containing protein [Myxococcota bacterium]